MKRIDYLIFLGCMVILCMIIIILRNDRSFLTRSVYCSEKDMMKKYEFSGIVLNKYYDYNNHNYNTINIIDIYNGKEFKLYFINERSGFYDSVVIQDTLIKIKNSLSIRNITKKRDFKLLYDCDE